MNAPEPVNGLACKVASFDVFDTILLRPVARPLDVFEFVSERLREQGLLDAAQAGRWARVRIRAETVLRRRSGAREVALSEIIALVLRDLGLPADHAPRMMAHELEVETQMCHVWPAAAAQVAAARHRGQTICFLSDMYLPGAFVRDLLLKGSVAQPGDAVFVSSESGCTKQDGSLFVHAAREMRVPLQALEHRGDNLVADVRVPRALGIAAQPVTETQLSRFEAIICDTPALPARTRTLLAGAARLARLDCGDGSPRDALIASVAAGVIAPLAIGFVAWCRAQARARGLTRLYFLARDGQTFFRVSSLIDGAERTRRHRLSSHYLFASRQAWHPAAIRDIGAEELRWMFMDERATLTFEQLCRRCNTPPGELLAALPPDLTLALTRAFGPEERARLACELAAVSAARALVLERAADARTLVLEYLRAEGAHEARACALVDVGWNGSLQRSYEGLLGIAGEDGASTAFYLGLLSRPGLAAASGAIAWLHDRTRPRAEDWMCPVGLIEQFFEADHGTTRGYARAYDGRVVPTFAGTENTLALKWGLAVQQETVAAAAAHFLRRANADDLAALGSPAFLDLARHLLDAFVYRPSAPESECFGRFPKTSSQDHDDARELAPACGFHDAMAMTLGTGPFATEWPAGSLVRSGYGWLAPVRRNRDRLRATLRSVAAAAKPSAARQG